MGKLGSFLRQTKWISRIIICLWFILSLLLVLSTYPDMQAMIDALPVSFMLLFVPALLIELSRNPVIRETKSLTIQFLSKTKVVSKVGFWIWLVGTSSTLGSARFYDIAFPIAFFLIPISVFELCSNPVIANSQSRVLKFLRNTKWISRGLFCAWEIFAVCGAGDNPSNFLYSIPASSVVFLLPAILIEAKCNPITKKQKHEPSIPEDAKPAQSDKVQDDAAPEKKAPLKRWAVKQKKQTPKPGMMDLLSKEDRNFVSVMTDGLVNHKEVLSEKRKLKGLLFDLFPQQRMEVNVLVQLYEQGILEEFQNSGMNDQMVYRITKKVCSEYGTSEEAAKRMSLVWCCCAENLGVEKG